MRKLSLIFSLALLLSIGGCRKRAAAPIPPTTGPSSAKSETAPPAVTPAVIRPVRPVPLEPSPLSKTITGPNTLAMGEMLFKLGSYAKAVHSFEAFLNDNPKSEERDVALFHLGLSRALLGDTMKEWRQAETAFRMLLSESPKSPYRRQAEYIIGLQGQIDKLRSELKDRDERVKKLSEELQRLKEIDLQRRPSRAPE